MKGIPMKDWPEWDETALQIYVPKCKLTSYFPSTPADGAAVHRLEGGSRDCHGFPLRTLEDFLQGRSEFVSCAMDARALIRYGTPLRIPALNVAFDREIDFRVVDNGGAFLGKGYSRLDICRGSAAATLDYRTNQTVEVFFMM